MSCALGILHMCQINLMFLSSNIFIWGLFQANIDPVYVTVYATPHRLYVALLTTHE